MSEHCGEAKACGARLSRHLYLGEGKEMLATLIPYFDKNMKVTAYAVASQRDNCLLNPPIFGTSALAGDECTDSGDSYRGIF